MFYFAYKCFQHYQGDFVITNENFNQIVNDRYFKIQTGDREQGQKPNF